MGAMKHLAMALDHYRQLVSDEQDGYALFDHGTRTVDELNLAVIKEALASGWNDLEAVHFTEDLNLEILEDHQYLSDLANDAETWLNDHVAPSGYAFSNDGYAGVFGLWKVDHD